MRWSNIPLQDFHILKKNKTKDRHKLWKRILCTLGSKCHSKGGGWYSDEELWSLMGLTVCTKIAQVSFNHREAAAAVIARTISNYYIVAEFWIQHSVPMNSSIGLLMRVDHHLTGNKTRPIKYENRKIVQQNVRKYHSTCLFSHSI